MIAAGQSDDVMDTFTLAGDAATIIDSFTDGFEKTVIAKVTLSSKTSTEPFTLAKGGTNSVYRWCAYVWRMEDSRDLTSATVYKQGDSSSASVPVVDTDCVVAVALSKDSVSPPAQTGLTGIDIDTAMLDLTGQFGTQGGSETSSVTTTLSVSFDDDGINTTRTTMVAIKIPKT